MPPPLLIQACRGALQFWPGCVGLAGSTLKRELLWFVSKKAVGFLSLGPEIEASESWILGFVGVNASGRTAHTAVPIPFRRGLAWEPNSRRQPAAVLLVLTAPLHQTCTFMGYGPNMRIYQTTDRVLYPQVATPSGKGPLF